MTVASEAARLMLAAQDETTVAGLRALKEANRDALLALKAEDEPTYRLVCAAIMAAYDRLHVPMPPWLGEDPSGDLIE